jgi:drug/metabolite transporter (DMT)-like permease
MTYLALRILFNVAFSHLLRLTQARASNQILTAFVNYLAAAVACGVWAVAAGRPVHAVTAGLGALAGLTYVTSMVLWLPAMRQSGVSVVGAVSQLALMLPVAVSVWRFREIPTAYQTLGISLTLAALPILSATSAVATGGKARFSFLTVLLFFSAGISQVVMKEFSTTRPAADLPVYSAALFLAATVGTALWMAVAPPRESAGEPPAPSGMDAWWIGGLMGAANVLQAVFLLKALRELPGIVVFPVSAALGIVVNALASMLFWQERPRPAGWLGLGLAVAAVVLLNLK